MNIQKIEIIGLHINSLQEIVLETVNNRDEANKLADEYQDAFGSNFIVCLH